MGSCRATGWCESGAFPYLRLKLLTLRRFAPVFGSSLSPAIDSLSVEHAADDMVPHGGKVFHSSSTHEHHAVFLKIVSFTGDVGVDFDPGRHPHTSHLTEGGIRFFGSHRPNPRANPSALRTSLQRRNLCLLRFTLAAMPNELAYCWHV